MSDSPAQAQLVVYAFGPGAGFEGWLVGALERLDLAGSLRVHDVLFVRDDPDTGEVTVFDSCGRDTRKLVVELLDFRLDPAARARATQRALAGDAGGVPPQTVRAVADAIRPGGAIVALLVDDGGADAFDDAAARAGGTAVVKTLVEARRLGDVPTDLRDAAAHR